MKNIFEKLKNLNDLEQIETFLNDSKITYYKFVTEFFDERMFRQKGNTLSIEIDDLKIEDKHQNKHSTLFLTDYLILAKVDKINLIINPDNEMVSAILDLKETDTEYHNEDLADKTLFEKANKEADKLYKISTHSTYDGFRQHLERNLLELLLDPADFKKRNEDVIQYEVLLTPNNIDWFKNIKADYRKVGKDDYGDNYEIAFNDHCIAVYRETEEEIQVYLFNFFNQKDFEREEKRINY